MKTIHIYLKIILTLLFCICLDAKQTNASLEPIKNNEFKWARVDNENAELKIEKKQETYEYAIQSKVGQYEYEDLDFTDSYIMSLSNEDVYRILFSSSFTLHDTMWFNINVSYKDSLKNTFDPATSTAYKRKNTKQESVMKLYYQPNTFIATNLSFENLSNSIENDEQYYQNLNTISHNKISLNMNADLDFLNIKTSLFQIVKANNIYGISHSQVSLEKTQELYKGIELTLSKQIFEDFRFSTSLKLREVEIQQSNVDDDIGKTPSYIPTNEVDVKAEYLFENIKFTSKMTYIGNRYSDISNNEKLGNYTVGTLGASFFTRFYDEDVKVDFNIKNILNRNYDFTSDTKGDSRNYIMNLLMMF